MLPVFPIRLLMIVLPFVIAGGVLAYVATRGVSSFKKQGVAWGLTALMIVAAIGIGYGKAHASVNPESVLRPTPPVSETVPPGYNSAAAYIRDGANVLSASTEKELASRTARLFNSYGVVIGVVTCNYGRDDLYDYALKQAENMGLGGRDFIVVLDISGDNYWLVQGADLVRYFTDEDCGDYAWDYMESYFARGDYDGAVRSLTEMLEAWYGTYFG